MKPARVHVHIDTLALPAQVAGNPFRVATSLQRELQRLLRGSPDMNLAPRSIAKLELGALGAPLSASNRTIASQMAGRVFAGLAGLPADKADRNG